MQDRLSFADDVGAKYGSMLAFPCTEGQLESNQTRSGACQVSTNLRCFGLFFVGLLGAQLRSLRAKSGAVSQGSWAKDFWAEGEASRAAEQRQ